MRSSSGVSPDPTSLPKLQDATRRSGRSVASRVGFWVWVALCTTLFVASIVVARRAALVTRVVNSAPALTGDCRLRLLVQGAVPTPPSVALSALAEAEVRVFEQRPDASFALVARGKTDAQGELALDQLHSGTFWVLAEANGWNRSSQTLHLLGERRLEFTLEHAQALNVQVLGDDEKPLKAATVLVQDQDALPFGALTDDAGRARLSQLGQGSYKLSVFARGYESFERMGIAGDQTVVLRRLGGLTVHVVDQQGTRVGRAEVTLVGSSLWPGRRIETNDNGDVEIAGLLSGVYDLRGRKGDRVSALAASISLERGEHREVTLELAQGRFIRVICRSEAPDSLPITGAEIVATEQGLSPFPISARSDENGKATLGPLSQAPVFIAAHAEGYVGRSALPVPQEQTPTMQVVLLHGATLQGRVVDGQGHAISSATIEIIGFDLDGLPIEESPELTGYRKAQFEATLAPLPLIPTGELGVTIGHLPYVNEINSQNAGGPQTSWSNPAAEPRTPWVSDIEGRFTIYPVPPGRVRALVRHPAYVEGLSETLSLEPGQQQSVTVVLEDGGHLLGRIVDERGFAVPDVRIQVTAPNATYERNLTSNADGAFELAATPSAITIALARPSDPMRFVLQKTVNVASGSDTELELTLPEARDKLLWLVLDEDHVPIELAQVTVTSLDPTLPLRVTRFSGADGLVGVEDASGLAVRVEVQAPGYSPSSEQMESAPKEHTFVLHHGTRVQGEITGVRGHVRVAGAEVSLETAERRLATLTDRDGRYDFRDVPQGQATLTVHHADYAPQRREVQIEDTGRADRPLELETIDLEEGSRASGTVIDSAGDPVAHARVALGRISAHVGRGSGTSVQTTTDDQGRFVLRGLPAGTVTLGALAPNQERGSVVVSLEAGEQTDDVVLQLGAAADVDEIESQNSGVAVSFSEDKYEDVTLVRIADVAAGSEAERAGLRAGDVVSRIDGAAIDSARAARAHTRGRTGQDVVIEVERNGMQQSYRVRLEPLTQ